MKGNFSDPFIHPNPFSSFSAVLDPGPRRRSPRIGESARQEAGDRRGPVAERAGGVEAGLQECPAGMSAERIPAPTTAAAGTEIAVCISSPSP